LNATKYCNEICRICGLNTTNLERKNYYGSRDIEFFLRDYFLARPVYQEIFLHPMIQSDHHKPQSADAHQILLDFPNWIRPTRGTERCYIAGNIVQRPRGLVMQLRSNIAHVDKSMRSRVFSSVPFQHHRARLSHPYPAGCEQIYTRPQQRTWTISTPVITFVSRN